VGQLVDHRGDRGTPGYGLGLRVFRILSGDRARGGFFNLGEVGKRERGLKVGLLPLTVLKQPTILCIDRF
jgi:hypothetical protein